MDSNNYVAPGENGQWVVVRNGQLVGTFGSQQQAEQTYISYDQPAGGGNPATGGNGGIPVVGGDQQLDNYNKGVNQQYLQQTLEESRRQFDESSRRAAEQFAASQAEQARQFNARLEQEARQLGLSQQQIDNQKAQFAASQAESRRQFDVNTTQRQTEFLKNTELELQRLGLSQQQINNQMAQFTQNLDWQRQQHGEDLGWERDKFGQQLEWDKDKFGQSQGQQNQQFWANMLSQLSGPRDWKKYQIAQTQMPMSVRTGNMSLMDIANSQPSGGAVVADPSNSWENTWANANINANPVASAGVGYNERATPEQLAQMEAEAAGKETGNLPVGSLPPGDEKSEMPQGAPPIGALPQGATPGQGYNTTATPEQIAAMQNEANGKEGVGAMAAPNSSAALMRAMAEAKDQKQAVMPSPPQTAEQTRFAGMRGGMLGNGGSFDYMGPAIQAGGGSMQKPPVNQDGSRYLGPAPKDDGGKFFPQPPQKEGGMGDVKKGPGGFLPPATGAGGITGVPGGGINTSGSGTGMGGTPTTPRQNTSWFSQPNRISQAQYSRMSPTLRAMQEGEWQSQGVDAGDMWARMKQGWNYGSAATKTRWR